VIRKVVASFVLITLSFLTIGIPLFVLPDAPGSRR